MKEFDYRKQCVNGAFILVNDLDTSACLSVCSLFEEEVMSYVPPLLHPSYCLSSPQSSPGKSPSRSGESGGGGGGSCLTFIKFSPSLLNFPCSTMRMWFTLSRQIKKKAISFDLSFDAGCPHEKYV